MVWLTAGTCRLAPIRWPASDGGRHARRDAEYRPKSRAAGNQTYLAFFAGPVVGSCDDRWPAIPGCENHGMADSVRHPVQGSVDTFGPYVSRCRERT